VFLVMWLCRWGWKTYKRRLEKINEENKETPTPKYHKMLVIFLSLWWLIRFIPNKIKTCRQSGNQCPDNQSPGNAIAKLELPWTVRHWNLFVANPANTNEVWARLIGPEFSVSSNQGSI
jgi:hypothetical protein